jgi:A/G-specific adenine glycosylase
MLSPVLRWYAGNARDLPWRRPGIGAWPVLVSEVMLQQTPVSRVLPAYDAWLTRWSTPSALAAASPGEAIRMWGRLGYPRRALRLHECAVAISTQHGGDVPGSVDELLALPGVGAYTARAVAAFAFGARVPVVDTNVQRVLGRAVEGSEPTTAVRAVDFATAAAQLPADPPTAVRFSAALMELGALVCTARTPRCGHCPLWNVCAWRLAGSPAPAGRPRRTQRFSGTDRQVRGLLLAVVRQADGPVQRTLLDAVWADAPQRQRALGGLLADGLVAELSDGRFRLPG